MGRSRIMVASKASRTERAPTAVRHASSAVMAASSSPPTASSVRLTRRGDFWVKKSTMMFAPRYWHQGRHSEMHSAMPNCVSSTSPGIGRVSVARRTTLATTISATAPATRPPAIANHQASLARVRNISASSLLVLHEQVLGVLQHLLAVHAALAHVGHPLVVQRRGGLDPDVGLGGGQ